jgi:GntR family transcriptional regulator
MELNNTIAKPLYKQLEDQLKEEIDTGKRKAGSRLPTENELSTTYNVSRVTVRKALAGLSELGYLDRKSGKGTFVAEKRIQRNISKGVTGFSEMCRTMGAVPGAKTIKIAIEDPTEKDMELMHITPDKKILVLERIRYADEKPVLLEINRFPESFSFLFGENLNDTSLYDVLQNHNIIFDHSDKTLDIVFASAQESKILGISKGYPLLRIESTIYNTDCSLVQRCKQLCIGDKFTI